MGYAAYDKKKAAIVEGMSQLNIIQGLCAI